METTPRITGTEMEWGLIAQHAKHKDVQLPITAYVSFESINRNLIDGLAINGGFLSNGGRLYLDIHNHLEYAGPEDASFWGTVVNEMAGEEIVYSYLEYLQDDHKIGRFWLNKRVVDTSGASWGHHENYLSPASSMNINQDYLKPLAIHLATRSIFCGAGFFEDTKFGKTFRIAQKNTRLTHGFHADTVKSKPLVNLRDEPEADEHEWKRVHVTSGDANMSPWSSWMALGTTSIVLRLMENGVSFRELYPRRYFVNIAKQVANDPTLTSLIATRHSGQKMTAVEIQERIVEKARIFQEQHGLPEEEAQILDEWERVVADLAVGDFSVIEDRVDWAMRLKSYKSYKEKHNGKLTDEQIEVIDMMYDEISLRSIGLMYRRTAQNVAIPTQQEIERATKQPPDSTRAKIRGRFILDHAGDKRAQFRVANWSTLYNDDIGTHTRLDPYQTEAPGWAT